MVSSASLSSCQTSLTLTPRVAAAPEALHCLLDGKHHDAGLRLVQPRQGETQRLVVRVAANKANTEQMSNQLFSAVFLKTFKYQQHLENSIYLKLMMIVPNQLLVPNELTKVDDHSDQFDEIVKAPSHANQSRINTHSVINPFMPVVP